MGPVLIFDKSFLESLTVNESVWLDSFFLTNIIPIFYVETLADLGKENKDGNVSRSTEEIVSEIVKKTPVLESCPNVFHQSLVLSNLLGQSVELSKHPRPVISGGKYKVFENGNVGIDFQQFPESAALERWKKGDFLEVERQVAKEWRNSLSNINFDQIIEKVANEVQNSKHFSSIEDVREFVEHAVSARHNQFIHFALFLLDVPEKYKRSILKRWYQTRPLPFNEFSPYASFVLKIKFFFYLCIKKSFLSISHKRKNTNVIDLSYLYYLPFCSIFVSSDNFHKKVVPLFLEKHQTFVVGQELKEDFSKLQKYYQNLPNEIKNMGTMIFATYPPTEFETLVSRLFDRHLGEWRESAKKHWSELGKPIKTNKEMLGRLKEKGKKYSGPPISSDKASHMRITKRVPIQRGEWRTLPVGIEKKSK